MNKRLFWGFSLYISWLFASVILNFFVIRKVIYFSHDLFQAGQTALAIYGVFNYLEILLSLVVFLLLIKQSKLLKILSSCTLFIALFYSLYLTPKIKSIAHLWQNALHLNLPQASDLQMDHKFFHSSYILFDTVKIIIILITLTIIYRTLLKEPSYGNRNT